MGGEWGGGGGGGTISNATLSPPECESVWPSGKGIRLVSRGTSVRIRFKSCGLWTSSCDFVSHNKMKH